MNRAILAAVAGPARWRLAAVLFTAATIAQAQACDSPQVDVPPADPDAAVQDDIAELVNTARADAGCAPLTLNPLLNQAADGHSEDMATRDYFDHISPEGSNPGDRITATGYQAQTWGENIAAGYPDAATVMAGWMDSPGHRANIENCSYNELGVGYAANPNTGNRPYWTQVFGTPR